MDRSSESSTPAQHTGMSPGSSSVGVMLLGGAAHAEEEGQKGATDVRNTNYCNTECSMCVQHYSQGTITSADTGSLVPTEFTENALKGPSLPW